MIYLELLFIFVNFLRSCGCVLKQFISSTQFAPYSTTRTQTHGIFMFPLAGVGLYVL